MWCGMFFFFFPLFLFFLFHFTGLLVRSPWGPYRAVFLEEFMTVGRDNWNLSQCEPSIPPGPAGSGLHLREHHCYTKMQAHSPESSLQQKQRNMQSTSSRHPQGRFAWKHHSVHLHSQVDSVSPGSPISPCSADSLLGDTWANPTIRTFNICLCTVVLLIRVGKNLIR